jgi:hypothetical protein
MQRAFSIALSLAAVVLSAVLAFRDAPSIAATVGAVSAAADAGTVAITDAGARSDAGLPAQTEPAPMPTEALEAPALGKSAPREVRFGVVLVSYEGAEGAPDKGARRKSDALALATRLAEEARRPSADFHAAVQRGDSGSSDDVGTVTRGVLEPEAEAALFALPVGGVSGVVDTPRGFWIVKRLE